MVHMLRAVARWVFGLDDVTEIILAEARRIVASQR